jgi:phosphatidylserine decarboxylase
MTIHKEGFKIIFVALIIFLAINTGVLLLTQNTSILQASLIITGILLLLVINFFRSPKRICPKINNAIFTPADGEVVVIEEVEEPEYLKTKCMQVSIFMTPFNVHVNWFPIGGLVKFVRHHSGRFMGAYLPKSSTENERTTVVIEHSSGKEILVRQVAGAVARRIVCYAKENTNVEQGQQMGFIKFGSRLDLYLPLDADIKVNIGDKVKGTQTVIAEF